MIAGPFDLRISPTLRKLNGNPDLGAASLSLYYVERSAGDQPVDVASLQIFAWDGQQWTALETAVIETGKLASAPIPFRNSTLALFGRRHSQLYMPFVQRE